MRIPVMIFKILVVVADFDRAFGQTLSFERAIDPDTVEKVENVQGSSFLTSAYDTDDRN